MRTYEALEQGEGQRPDSATQQLATVGGNGSNNIERIGVGNSTNFVELK